MSSVSGIDLKHMPGVSMLFWSNIVVSVVGKNYD